MTENEINIMNEAFMIGRIYAINGEKESPAEIHEKLMKKCEILSIPVEAEADVKIASLKEIEKIYIKHICTVI